MRHIRPELPENGVITAQDILGFLRLRFVLILTTAAAVTAVSCFLTLYLLTPSYEASASVMIDASQVRPAIDAAPASDFEKVVTFQTQIDIIKSTGIAGQVVAQLNLGQTRVKSRIEKIADWARDRRSEIGYLLDIPSWQKPDDPVADSVAAIIANTDVQAKPQSVVLKISYTAHDPKEAAATVNAIVAAYTHYFNKQLNDRASGVVIYLSAQIEDVSKRLTAAEQALVAFKQNDRVDVGDGGGSSAPTGTTATLAGQAATQAGQRSDPPSGLAGVTDSPKVEEEMKVLVLGMDEELRKMQIQFPASYQPMQVLKAKIARYIAALNQLPRKELELARLNRQAEFEQDTYKYLRQNLERSRIVEVSNTNSIGLVTVLESAEPNDRAIAPKPRLIIPAGLVFGLALGVVIGAIVTFFDRRIFSLRDLERSIDMRVLGALPRG